MAATTDHATTKVINTPEILELILLHTDMRTLLTSAQLVCRNWFKLIIKSPSIQKALFYVPIKDSEWGVNEKIPNPLLAEAFPSIFPAEDRPARQRFTFSTLKWTEDPSRLARFVRPDASWRRMLVQQPPISELGLFHVTSAMGGDSAGTSRIRGHDKDQAPGLKEGFRMERLLDVLLFNHSVQFYNWSTVRVYWAIEEPVPFNESYAGINEEFHRVLAEYGLVLFTRDVRQCSIEARPPTVAEIARRAVIEAYRGHGLDVDSRRREINLLKDGVTGIRDQRRPGF